MFIDLSPAQILHIEGADASFFAQAQFCNDIDAVADGQWQWNAWLSPQGRVKSFFHLLRDSEDQLRLLLRGGSALALRDALQRYVFRSRVHLRASELALTGRDDAASMSLQQQHELGHKIVLDEQGNTILALPGDSPRSLRISPPTAPTAAPEHSVVERWRVQDIRAGIVTLTDAAQDKFLPGWLGLDKLDAYSVRKGCYPGQEIIARLHFKGGAKRSLHRLKFFGRTPGANENLIDGDDDTSPSIGTIVNVACIDGDGGVVLAVLHNDRVQSRMRTAGVGGIELHIDEAR